MVLPLLKVFSFIVSHFKQTLKSFRVYVLFKRLQRARNNTIRKKNNQKPIYAYYDYFVYTWQYLLNNSIFLLTNAYQKVKSKLTDFQKKVIKSVFAFILGIILAWTAFLFVYHETDTNRIHTILFGVSVLFVLSLGLPVSQFIRNIVALIVPILLSSKSRIIILGYIYILTFNGPVRNISKNMDEINRSIACGKALAVNITKETFKELLEPLVIAKNAIKNVVIRVQRFVYQIKEAFEKMKELFAEITRSIKNMFQWLNNIVNVCNAKLGDPHDKCLKAFDDGYYDCRRKLKIAKGLCKIVSAIKPICDIVKIGKLLCEFPAAVKRLIVEKINAAFRGFLDDIYNEFYVNVTFEHVYKYNMIKSRTYESVLEGIRKDFHEKFVWIWNVVDIVSFIFTFVTVYLIFKAWMYRQKYLLRDHFDNIYITKDFKKIDFNRARKSLETILPLNFRERRRYIYPFSWKMNAAERVKFSFGFWSLFTTSCQSLFFIAVDYLLFSMMSYTRHLLYTISILRLPARGYLHVKGHGALAEMYRDIGDDLNPIAQIQFKRETDCSPNPLIPDYDNYERIAFYVLFALATVLGESYSLRTRHAVMGYFFPRKAKERAVWLYNVVLNQRGSFLKYMRRQLRRRVLGDTSIEEVSFFQRLCAIYPFLGRLKRMFFKKRKSCVMCTKQDKSKEENELKSCDNPGCSAYYCNDCFEQMENVCILCKRPVEYGDVSDESEEKDSSDEEMMYDYSEDWSYQDHTASEMETDTENETENAEENETQTDDATESEKITDTDNELLTTETDTTNNTNEMYSTIN